MPKKKSKKNISGLRNQSKTTSTVKETVDEACLSSDPPRSNGSLIDEQADNDEDWDPHVRLDSNKECWDSEDEESDGDDGEADDGNNEDDEFYQSEGLQVGMLVLAIEEGDDPRDEDWIPDSVRKKQQTKLARARPRPKFYRTGPCIADKAPRTQRRYRNELRTQQSLESFGFSSVKTKRQKISETSVTVPSQTQSTEIEIKREDEMICPTEEFNTYKSLIDEDSSVQVREETPDPIKLFSDDDTSIRQESLTPPPLLFDDQLDELARRVAMSLSACASIDRSSAAARLPSTQLEDHSSQKRKASGELEQSDEERVGEFSTLNEDQSSVEGLSDEETEELEAWEEELDQTLAPNVEIRDWGGGEG